MLVISLGKGLGIKPRGIQVALATALQESSMQPWSVNDDYVGLFQQLYDPTTGQYGAYDRLDPVGASRMFYEQLVALVPKYATDKRKDWQLAEAVQQTREGKLFDTRRATAVELMKKYAATTAAYEFEPVEEPVCTEPADATSTGPSGISGTFDPGMIISDDVFYNSGAMTVDEIRDFIDTKGADCSGDWCLKNISGADPGPAGRPVLRRLHAAPTPTTPPS